MNPTEIEFAIRDLVAAPYDPETFPYELIRIYNAPKATITKLRGGVSNAAQESGDLLWRKWLFFRSADKGEDVAAVGEAMRGVSYLAKHKPRFIFVTNGLEVFIHDLKLDETCNVDFEHLDEQSDFLLPLAGFERRAAVEEHPADIKAAKRLKKLYDAILAANPTWSSASHTHELNVFMTRVLFCLYAEDTGIFDTPKIFRNAVTQQTQEDGSDVASFLDRLFQIMNVEEAKRPADTPTIDLKFPYVNGSLFETTLEVPQFNRTVRRLLLECAGLDWKTINPDIFGSMIQTIAEPGARGDLGMHYTSVPNIMKALQPLFLDELHAAYDKAKDSLGKLESLLNRLSRIRVFDPACGSGNFLIISYKALRQLEIDVLVRIGDIAPNAPLRLSGIVLENFFGIDIVDFACETAKLSLWIAEHQMNTLFRDAFGNARPTLPLVRIATIHNRNALGRNWNDICPQSPTFETYICGNPPYAGRPTQTASQREDLAATFSPFTRDYRNLDLVSAWLLKATEYINGSSGAVAAFVATNSICQGEQVPLLWPLLLKRHIAIGFARTSFKWSNSASNNAGITCIVVGLKSEGTFAKSLYHDDHVQQVQHINPYLVPTQDDTVVVRRPSPLCLSPSMTLGNQPTDDGNLILSPSERKQLLEVYPEAVSLVRRYVGADEFINHIERYCLWIDDEHLGAAEEIPPVKDRIERVRRFRAESPKAATVAAAQRPHEFQDNTRKPSTSALIIPIHTSERRQYLQIGLLSDSVMSNATYAVYDPPPELLAILSSRLHRVWAEVVAGKLETRIRYSNTLVYNTFPMPRLSQEQRRTLGEHTKTILRARARFPGKTVAELYNPETMPGALLQAHQDNDSYLEGHVYGRRFKDDTQRLETLFTLYSRLVHLDEHRDTMFAQASQKAE